MACAVGAEARRRRGHLPETRRCRRNRAAGGTDYRGAWEAFTV